MADGKRRGGFARLAAVVKAERAKGGHVVFAHGGDTLSPSLMSGIDQGAHIIALTNARIGRFFVPRQSRVDFSKPSTFKRMAEANFPVFAARQTPAARRSRRRQDRDIVSFDGVRIGLTGAAHDGTPRSELEDLRFLRLLPAMKAQAEALRRDGVDLVVVVMHADRQAGRRSGRDPYGRCDPDRPQPRPLHPVRRPHADGRVGLRRALCDGHRPAHRDQAAGQPARSRMVAAIPRGRHRDGDAGPRGRGRGCGLPAGAGPRDERAADDDRGHVFDRSAHGARRAGRDPAT